ncbi:MAG: adenylate/guanylate cyclase domain-containing protein [Acidiferrobacterales bacterium]
MERQSRTWLCSVVFLDIVGYTEKAVAQQIETKEHLQKLVSDAVASIAETERIIVDTGDGAALCFLGDPEEALFVALNLRDLLAVKVQKARTPFEVRIGINLGPVKVVKSISGQLNPLGDGINNAQRVMSFAKPNQILVSRSFYDVIACLSQEYAQLFVFVGTRKDKHVKEHTVYEVRIPGKEQTYATARAVTERTRDEKEEELIALTWDPTVLKAAERALANHIGPVAKVLVSRAAPQAANIEELYNSLAAMIPSENERKVFLARAPAGAQATQAAPRSATRKVAGATKQATTATNKPAASWDEETLKTIERDLAVHVGPLAKVLVKKAAKKATSLEELHTMLAREIPTEKEQDAFLRGLNKKKSAG